MTVRPQPHRRQVLAVLLLVAGCGTSSPSPTTAPAPAGTPPQPSAAGSGDPAAVAGPALGAPAGNGLIAYESDGDIFVGDPVTGTSVGIVTGASHDTRPIFSPDGLRIAFLRAESLSDGTVVVVRADGSDERVVATEALTNGIPGSAWTPDSTSILLNHDKAGTGYWDGLLSLVDVSGGAEPRLITPPLPAQVGYTYFSIHDPVAPMFRPPNADQIVGVVQGVLSVVDIDGRQIEGFVPPSQTDEPSSTTRLAWSRDGSMIASGQEFGLFVMNADGSDPRRFDAGHLDRAWSPDSSRIALEKPVTVSGSAGSVITILEIETGAERVLDATFAITKDQANPTTDPDAFRTDSIRTWHEYAYESWSWSPDGRSIVVLERHGTRPFFVNIETGGITELPWEIDGAPSWQRVLP
jgi:Tol biopolymer transport system component